MDEMRFEVARELGLDGAQEGYFGLDTCVQCGKYGQILSRRARQLMQDPLPLDMPLDMPLDSVPKIRHNEADKPKIRRKSKP